MTSCSHSQGWRISRVTMSKITVVQNPTQQDAAEDHQDHLDAIQRAPFQVALPLRDEVRVETHDEH